MKMKDAVAHIRRRGILLTYPIKNAKDPASLWSMAYPRSEMRWEWDDSGDNRVAELWHLREELSRSKEVVYAKWYQNRATFFSKEVFTALRARYQLSSPSLSREAKEIMAVLQESSPQSTKALKKAVGLQGKILESTYERAMKSLWKQLLIVGFGEVDEGAFPSLAVGASQLIFEELEFEASRMEEAKREAILAPTVFASEKFTKYFNKTLSI